MSRFRITPSVIPNLFTAMNMFCGFLSIINASQGQYFYAASLIIIAAVFDALDGMMARLTHSSSELGVELDSLSDLVSFGAAHAFLIYQTQLISYNSFGVVISSLLMIAGGFRLARFNVQLVGFEKSHFTGLPIPSSAITIAAFVITYYQKGIGFQPPFSYVTIPLVITLSLLMVSTIKYDTLPKFTLSGIKEKPAYFGFIIVAAILIIATKGNALFFIFVFLILFGIFRHIFYMLAKKF
ncbi:MAG: CDP-diacylglycerol--serine O-phosphatidyltransferase [Ignavibacteriaceae bacterium]|nr:CDP-diacylglycerol--serine O-phosphatidyltransferase [Ignavibacteriaceae bacterium]